jgi:hypothetical protein
LRFKNSRTWAYTGPGALSEPIFDEATFAKMEGMAQRLLPDILLFASMDREPTVLNHQGDRKAVGEAKASQH